MLVYECNVILTLATSTRGNAASEMSLTKKNLVIRTRWA